MRIKFILLIIFCFSAIGWIWQNSLVKKDREARKLYSEGKIDEALSRWRDAQIESPDKEELHYNIGGALHRQKKYKEAYNEYEKSLDTKNAELQAKAYYNIGNTHYRMRNLLAAIEDYKKCLDINPDDKDAKYNIEFIRKKIKENLQNKQGAKQKHKQEHKQQGQQAQQQKKQRKQTKTEEDKNKGLEAKEEKEKEKQKQAEEKRKVGKEKKKQAQQEEAKKGEMSKEDAIRLLNALRNDETNLQRELRTQPQEGGYKVDKDW